MGKTLSLEDIAERIADAILSEAIINKTAIIPRIKTILYTWHKLTNRPANYDSIKTDKGKLLWQGERLRIERDFWKGKTEQSQPQYDELNQLLEDLNYKTQD